MEFVSPRFAGDPVLEEILNDLDDTGTKKLQDGSPEDSVIKVQQALFDLGWTARIDPPVSDQSTFVIGTYGPLTTKTVLAYKTHYDIRFPPLDPAGILDGFAGPRTLRSLDGHCVLFDQGAAAIAETATIVAAASATEAAQAPQPVVNSTVQQYANDALRRKGGNTWDAWLDLTSQREGNCADLELAIAEHYMFARGSVHQGVPPAVVVAWVVAYASFNLTGPGRLLKTGKCEVTPASPAQVEWGTRGAYDGVADLLL